MNTHFQSGQWEVDPGQRQIKSQDARHQLEPRVMSLLLYFLSHPQQTLTKEQIVEAVWQGSVVSDSAIAWTLAQLRKALGDDKNPRQYIQTLAKQGYRWLPEVKELTYLDTPAFAKPAGTTFDKGLATDQSPGSQGTSTRFVLITLIIIFLVIVLSTLWVKPPKDTLLTGVTQPLTSLAGREESPRFSPDELYISFAHRDPQTARWQTMIKPLYDDHELIATDRQNRVQNQTMPSLRQVAAWKVGISAQRINSPVWSPNSRQLAYVACEQTHCDLRLVNLNQQRQATNDEVIMSLSNRGLSQLSWGANANSLFYSDADAQGRYQVYQLDIAKRTSRQVSQAEHFPGDVLVRYTPTSNALLTVSDENSKFSHFTHIEVENGERQHLFSRVGRYYDVDWAVDGQSFYLNQGPAQIFEYHLQSQEITPKYQAGTNQVFGLVSDSQRQHYLVVSASSNTSYINVFDLHALRGNAKSATPLQKIDSNYKEWLPVFDQDNSLYFVSDRSGTPQIWHQQATASARQVSNLADYQLFSALAYHPQGRKIVGTAGQQIQSISETTGIAYKHSLQGQDVANPSWSEDGQWVYFSQRYEQTWYIVRTPYSQQLSAPEKILPGDYASEYNGRLYIANKASCELQVIELSSLPIAQSASSSVVALDVCAQSNAFFATEVGVYYEKLTGDDAGIYLWQPDQPQKQILSRKATPGRGFSLNQDRSRIAIQQYDFEQSDLFILQQGQQP